MPSNKRQKELARRRAERQAARRAAERARRRKRRAILGLSLGGAAAAIVAVLFIVSAMRDGEDAVDDPAAAVACDATKPPEPKKQTFEKAEQVIDAKKSYVATMKTSCGEISFELFADKAPKTANSFAFLASKNFYDGTFCHRMTAMPTLTVLQCGDPEGTGGGGPGYSMAEENLEGAKYPRGTVAMAKTQQPGSTGSQFFLVGKDSELPPEYTVAGRMDAKSLEVLDRIMAIGIEGDQQDGAPKQRVYIETFAVTEKK